MCKQQSFITVERETLAQERETIANTRHLSSMYIPNMKEVLKKQRLNTTSSQASCSGSVRKNSSRSFHEEGGEPSATSKSRLSSQWTPSEGESTDKISSRVKLPPHSKIKTGSGR